MDVYAYEMTDHKKLIKKLVSSGGEVISYMWGDSMFSSPSSVRNFDFELYITCYIYSFGTKLTRSYAWECSILVIKASKYMRYRNALPHYSCILY